MMRKTTNAKILLAAFAAVLSLSGCQSPAKQAIKHDQEMRKQVEQQKKKSNAYPVNGSNSDSYIP